MPRGTGSPTTTAGRSCSRAPPMGVSAWETARTLYDPVWAQTIGTVIGVLPNGTLVNFSSRCALPVASRAR